MFLFFPQLSSSQKYIYTWTIINFLDVLKSYGSESFISEVLVSLSKIMMPPDTHASGDLGEIHKTA